MIKIYLIKYNKICLSNNEFIYELNVENSIKLHYHLRMLILSQNILLKLRVMKTQRNRIENRISL